MNTHEIFKRVIQKVVSIVLAAVLLVNVNGQSFAQVKSFQERLAGVETDINPPTREQLAAMQIDVFSPNAINSFYKANPDADFYVSPRTYKAKYTPEEMAEYDQKIGPMFDWHGEMFAKVDKMNAYAENNKDKIEQDIKKLAADLKKMDDLQKQIDSGKYPPSQIAEFKKEIKILEAGVPAFFGILCVVMGVVSLLATIVGFLEGAPLLDDGLSDAPSGCFGILAVVIFAVLAWFCFSSAVSPDSVSSSSALPEAVRDAILGDPFIFSKKMQGGSMLSIHPIALYNAEQKYPRIKDLRESYTKWFDLASEKAEGKEISEEQFKTALYDYFAIYFDIDKAEPDYKQLLRADYAETRERQIQEKLKAFMEAKVQELEAKFSF